MLAGCFLSCSRSTWLIVFLVLFMSSDADLLRSRTRSGNYNILPLYRSMLFYPTSEFCSKSSPSIIHPENTPGVCNVRYVCPSWYPHCKAGDSRF